MKGRIDKQQILLPPRGTKDLFEPQLLEIEAIKSIFFKIARSHGFTRIDLPIFEKKKVFERTAEFSEESSFLFMDKSGRRMVLRPDINAPISRAYVNRLSNKYLPAKLFFEGKVFRYRHTRRREFRMFGLETYGVSSFSADAEIISIVGEMTRAIGFKGYRVEYSNLQIYKRILNACVGLSGAREILYNLRSIKNKESARKMLDCSRVPENDAKKIVYMLFAPKKGIDDLNLLGNLVENSKILSEELKQVIFFKDALRDYGVINARFSLSNLHGTGFYSGLTFRLQLDGVNSLLADGGRYDSMVENLGGKSTAATGLAFGIERIIDMAEKQGINISRKKKNGLIVSLFGSRGGKEIRSILGKIRDENSLVIEEEQLNRKVVQVKKYGAQKGYHFALFIENSGLINTWPLKLTLYSLINFNKRKKIVTIKNPEELANFFKNYSNGK